jgi:hypothetical protein
MSSFFTLENLTHFFTEERIKKLAEVVKESATEITAIQVAEALGLSAVEAEMLVAGLKLGKELVCREKEVVTLKSKKDIDDLFKKKLLFHKSPGLYVIGVNENGQYLTDKKVLTKKEIGNDKLQNVTKCLDVFGYHGVTGFFVVLVEQEVKNARTINVTEERRKIMRIGHAMDLKYHGFIKLFSKTNEKNNPIKKDKSDRQQKENGSEREDGL